MTDEVETEDAAPLEQPEPKPIGHGVVQDNVSEPGVQHTHQVDEEGEILETSSHDEAEAAGAVPVEDEADDDDAGVESEDALTGAAGAAAADDGSGDGGADDEE